MKFLLLIIFLLNVVIINTQHNLPQDNPETSSMSDEEFINIMNSQSRVIANSDVHESNENYK